MLDLSCILTAPLSRSSPLLRLSSSCPGPRPSEAHLLLTRRMCDNPGPGFCSRRCSRSCSCMNYQFDKGSGLHGGCSGQHCQRQRQLHTRSQTIRQDSLYEGKDSLYSHRDHSRLLQSQTPNAAEMGISYFHIAEAIIRSAVVCDHSLQCDLREASSPRGMREDPAFIRCGYFLLFFNL
ncbi:hypothetical protein BDW75DRAFT_204567 [Aspergillus navahoensis]